MTHRPVPLPVCVDGIPGVLRDERRWALWRYEWRDQRWPKIPYQASGVAAKSNDPTTWTDFASALAASRSGRFDGLMFALGDGWAGVDVDHCLNRPNLGLALLRALGGYRETSPSGMGIKIIGRSPRIGGEINYGQASPQPVCTTWSAPRFFTVTGQDSSGDPRDDITIFIDARFPAPIAPAATRDGYADAVTTSDDELLLQMIGTDTVGDAILALWRGDTIAYDGDHSRADQALCCHLAWWTNYDVDRIDRLFRQSGLMRPKWNTASYRRATLGKALR
jgi:putative DNA primase/helicase